MHSAGRFMRHNQSSDIKIEPASNDLANFLRAKFPVGRLRTGTPPRLNRKTIDYKNLAIQESDVEPKWFSFRN
jgi:tRNA uridine 5-carboxymethylaminomethyl modification enzyme